MTEARGPNEPKRPDALGEASDVVRKRVDKAIDGAFQTWWTAQSSERRTATSVLIGAALVGVVGMPIVSAIRAASNPVLDSRTVTAVFLLAVLTLPLFVYCGVLSWGVGRYGVALLGAASIGAYFAGVVLAGTPLPTDLGDFYCFASLDSNGVYYEQACRTFDAVGFLQQTQPLVGSPSRSPEVFKWAVVYVAEARGIIMALCGIAGGTAAGYLCRPVTT